MCVAFNVSDIERAENPPIGGFSAMTKAMSSSITQQEFITTKGP